MIDLRSDTVTRPGLEMRKVMREAEVGDDVYGEDPTVNALEAKAAEMLGKEAALFVPSGTMGNQIAVGAQTQPGDEVLLDPSYHIYLWEGGGLARLWGVTTRSIEGDQGILTLEHLQDKIRPQDPHFPRTRMVCLENTLNRAGGKVYPYEEIVRISTWAKEHGLVMHLDGARLFNAVMASGISVSQWAMHFDSISICLSKGLGAPVGSLLIGSRELIERGRRLRKVLGGGMRQAGVLAAAGLYSLEHNIPRLAEDHALAQKLAQAVETTQGLELEFGRVETNLVWIRIHPSHGDSRQWLEFFKAKGVLINASGPQLIRLCTHLDVNEGQINEVIKIMRERKP